MLRWLGAAKRKQNQLQQRNQTNSELSERRTDDLSGASPMNENNSEQIVHFLILLLLCCLNVRY